MDWKNWAGGQRTWRCAATRDTWLITWLVTRVTWLIICLAVLCQHWWAVWAKSKLEMQSFFHISQRTQRQLKCLLHTMEWFHCPLLLSSLLTSAFKHNLCVRLVIKSHNHKIENLIVCTKTRNKSESQCFLILWSNTKHTELGKIKGKWWFWYELWISRKIKTKYQN